MHIGLFLDLLDELGIADNTIVFYSTDNGVHMNTWPDGGMTPFRSDKNTNWEGAMRVPAFLRWPGHIQAGSVTNEKEETRRQRGKQMTRRSVCARSFSALPVDRPASHFSIRGSNKMRRLLKGSFVLAITILTCSTEVAARRHEPLPSWNDGLTKSAITDFVQRITNEGSPDYVLPAERIAVFDNDGCLWSEKPMSGQPPPAARVSDFSSIIRTPNANGPTTENRTSASLTRVWTRRRNATGYWWTCGTIGIRSSRQSDAPSARSLPFQHRCLRSVS